MSSRSKLLTGTAGEHYVAYQLSKRGFVVGLTRGGTQSIDLSVANEKGDKRISIQVKTMDSAFQERKRKPENSHWQFFVHEKGFEHNERGFLYAFVDMKGKFNEHPSVFIVPSKDVIECLGPNPEDWSIPSFILPLNEKDKYLERWDIIEKLLR